MHIYLCPPQSIKQRCLAYHYNPTWLDLLDRCYVYIENADGLMSPVQFEHRCLEYCYTYC